MISHLPPRLSYGHSMGLRQKEGMKGFPSELSLGGVVHPQPHVMPARLQRDTGLPCRAGGRPDDSQTQGFSMHCTIIPAPAPVPLHLAQENKTLKTNSNNNWTYSTCYCLLINVCVYSGNSHFLSACVNKNLTRTKVMNKR